MKKCRTTWKVRGNDADIGIAEFRLTEGEGAASYEETKTIVLERLRAHIKPFLARIEELESDHFLLRGALPPIKAWQAQFRHEAVVTAKTKKRATELVCETKYGFDTYWEECDGDWWYELARQEAVWHPQVDACDVPTGEFQRCLTVDEATEILREYVRPYRTVDPQKLLPLLESEQSYKATTEDGVAYEITKTAWNYDPGEITVHFRISDGSGVIWLPSINLERELSKEVVAWKYEGF